MKGIFPSPEFDSNRPRISLEGMWAFSYDPADAGEQEEWFASEKVLPERIEIAGYSQAHDYKSAGRYQRNTDVYIPEQSRTIMARYGCMCPSWYQHNFMVPQAWQGQQIYLHVGGVKPAVESWINGHKLGSSLTSRSPVRCDLTSHVRFDEESTVTIRIHWPRFRLDGMFDILHAWSGLYRSIWIEAVPAVHLADLHIRSSINPRRPPSIYC